MSILLAVLLMQSTVDSSRSESTSSNRIALDLTRDRLDPWLFRVSGNAAGGRWIESTTGLTAVSPATRAHREPLKVTARLRLRGDFRIEVRWKAPQAPRRTDADSVHGIELVAGSSRPVVVGHYRESGGAYDRSHIASAGMTNKRPARDPKSGGLSIARRGNEWTVQRAEGRGSWEQLAGLTSTVEPIEEIRIQVISRDSSSRMDWVLDQLMIEADRMEPVQTHAVERPWGRRVTVAAVLVFVSALLGGVVRRIKSRGGVQR